MENNLEVAGVEATEKVLFATHYLAGPARAWWTTTRAMNAGQIMTWADFKLKFSKYHVPPGLIKKMRDEFRELKQRRMSMVESLSPPIKRTQTPPPPPFSPLTHSPTLSESPQSCSSCCCLSSSTRTVVTAWVTRRSAAERRRPRYADAARDRDGAVRGGAAISGRQQDLHVQHRHATDSHAPRHTVPSRR
ncbi:hypothetical protein QYE76_043322 [Lolium multiflorum]|uniref:Retrotransposon gag domain-containing protein n=1 Tax=Lolium multiflorum TaxID=4521 RepID=A0AAD8WVY7_LOLMU|nr:hypothetical protein QYE76_043322 [Lolium multiflorum]